MIDNILVRTPSITEVLNDKFNYINYVNDKSNVINLDELDLTELSTLVDNINYSIEDNIYYEYEEKISELQDEYQSSGVDPTDKMREIAYIYSKKLREIENLRARRIDVARVINNVKVKRERELLKRHRDSSNRVRQFFDNNLSINKLHLYDIINIDKTDSYKIHPEECRFIKRYIFSKINFDINEDDTIKNIEGIRRNK